MKCCFFLLAAILVAGLPETRSIAHSLTSIRDETEPRELIVVNQQAWYLAANGKITVYDAQGSALDIPSVREVKAKHITNDGNDVVAQIGDKLTRWTSADATWHEIGELKMPVFALAVNSQKLVYAIADKGVWDVGQNTFSLPTSSPNNQIREPEALSAPAACFMDAQDNLWIGYGYGEWGGNIYIYSTRHHKFIDLKFGKFQINLHPIKSFFQLNADVGVSSGLQHMMNSGTIAQFHEYSAQILYDSYADNNISSQKSRWKSINELPYIGPATYAPDTEQIYFYSQKGVFKAKAGDDLSKLRNWELIFTPKLHWRSGQADAVGSPMNVLKMLSLGAGKLVLLTQNDGVGIWDGASFKLLP